MQNRKWYYVKAEERQGPVTETLIRSFLESGLLTNETLVWSKGMDDWRKISETSTFNDVPPPVPSGNRDQPATQHSPSKPPVPAEVSDRPTSVYAGFWKRVGAFLVDQVILLVSIVPLSFALGFWMSLIDFSGDAGAVGQFLGFVATWIYAAAFESSRFQATLGKMALGIKVTDLHGDRIGFGRATGRHFGKILSGLILAFGYVMVAFTEKKQGLHDKLADCLVINDQE